MSPSDSLYEKMNLMMRAANRSTDHSAVDWFMADGLWFDGRTGQIHEEGTDGPILTREQAIERSPFLRSLVAFWESKGITP